MVVLMVWLFCLFVPNSCGMALDVTCAGATHNSQIQPASP